MAAGPIVLWRATQAGETEVVASPPLPAKLKPLEVVVMDRLGRRAGAAYKVLEIFLQLLQDGLDETRRKKQVYGAVVHKHTAPAHSIAGFFIQGLKHISGVKRHAAVRLSLPRAEKSLDLPCIPGG